MNISNLLKTTIYFSLWSIYSVRADEEAETLSLVPENVVSVDEIEETVLPNYDYRQMIGKETDDQDPRDIYSVFTDAFKHLQVPSDITFNESIDVAKNALTDPKLLQNLLDNLRAEKNMYWFNELKKSYEIPDGATDDEIIAIMIERHKLLFDRLPEMLPQLKDPQALEQVNTLMENPEIKKMIELNARALEGSMRVKQRIGKNAQELTKEQIEEIFDEEVKEPLTQLLGEEGYKVMRDANIKIILDNDFSEQSYDAIRTLYEKLSAHLIDSIIEAGEFRSGLNDDTFTPDDEGSEGNYDLIDLDDGEETSQPKSTTEA